MSDVAIVPTEEDSGQVTFLEAIGNLDLPQSQQYDPFQRPSELFLICVRWYMDLQSS